MKSLNLFTKSQLNKVEMFNLKGGSTYAIYCEGQLCCFVNASSQADATAYAKSTYGSGASAVKE